MSALMSTLLAAIGGFFGGMFAVFILAMCRAASESRRANQYADLVTENEKLKQQAEDVLPLVYAVGQCGRHEVPMGVYDAWTSPDGYRSSTLYLQRQTIDNLDDKRIKLEREVERMKAREKNILAGVERVARGWGVDYAESDLWAQLAKIEDADKAALPQKGSDMIKVTITKNDQEIFSQDTGLLDAAYLIEYVQDAVRTARKGEGLDPVQDGGVVPPEAND